MEALLLAAGGVIGGIIGAVVTGIVTIATMQHKQRIEVASLKQKHFLETSADRRETEAAAVEQYASIVEIMRQRDAEWKADSEKKQRLIDDLVERDTLCQVRLARQWGWTLQADGWMQQAHERLNWLAAITRKEGRDIGELVAPPRLPKPPPDYDDSPGFAARSSKQDTENLKASNPITTQAPGAT